MEDWGLLGTNFRNKYECKQISVLACNATKKKSFSHCWSSETLNSRQQSPTAPCYEYSAWVNFSPEEREEAFLYTAALRGYQCAGNIVPDFLPPVFTGLSLRRSLHRLMHSPLIVKG